MKLLECAHHLKDGWLQDECCCRHLRVQEFTQDKTRREEYTSLSQSLTNLVEVQYSQNQSYYFKDLSLPFIIERVGHKVQGKLTREALKGYLLTLPILAPKGVGRGTFLDLS